jgi:anthranilate synthase component 1
MFQAFQSCFPRGTVTGAPKIRAMHLLSEIEPEQRGVYSGVVGYFDFFGNMDAAIAIRSALVKDHTAHVNAGAGVVYDSVPEAEYEETRNKAKSILKAILLAERAQSAASPAENPKIAPQAPVMPNIASKAPAAERIPESAVEA